MCAKQTQKKTSHKYPPTCTLACQTFTVLNTVKQQINKKNFRQETQDTF